MRGRSAASSDSRLFLLSLATRSLHLKSSRATMSRSSNSPLTVRVPGSRASSAVAYPAAYDPEEEQREIDAKLDEHVGVRDEVSAKMKQNAVRAPVPHTRMSPPRCCLHDSAHA